MTVVHEQALQFPCEGAWLPAILHRPEAAQSIGVVIVVGGPQYRVGSHRQFVLLARDLAAAGYPVLRFDYRGMGDAEGEPVDFEGAGPDITAAIDTLLAEQPQLECVVLWGLCDAASAALFLGPRDARIGGLVLLNPWARTESGAARATLQHYYGERLRDVGAWWRLLRNPLGIARSVTSMVSLRRASRRANPALGDGRSLPQRMLNAAEAYRGSMLWILSGRDLTADEFRDVVASDPRWQAVMARDDSQRAELGDANHTFSSAAQRDAVARLTCDWLDRLRHSRR